MFFLNLTAPEFFVLLGALSTLVTALYLLDRVKRKKVVSSLRFWIMIPGSHDQRSRRRLRDPWSLVLQLLGLLLLLLAIAQLEWGNRGLPARDHVLILDSSAWTGERLTQGILLSREKQTALDWAASLSPADRIMLIRADDRPVPLTPFSADRKAFQSALRGVRPSGSALNMAAAMQLASRAQSASFVNPGSVVYIGPEMLKENAVPPTGVRNLRVIPIEPDLNNVGIRRISVREVLESGLWNAAVTVANYGPVTARRTLLPGFGRTAFVSRSLTLLPDEEKTIEFSFKATSAGLLTADLQPGDSLPADDHARVWLPQYREWKVVVYTQRPELMSSLFPPDGRMSVTFKNPSAYNPRIREEDLAIFDQFAPPSKPPIPSLWIAPPAAHSPAPVTGVLTDVSVSSWENNERSGIKLQSKDFHVDSTEAFEVFPGDVPIARVGSDAVVIGRPARPRLAAIGFDPLGGDLRYQVTTPLLFADLLSWLTPEAFRSVEVSAGHVGLFTSDVDDRPAQLIRVTDEDGRAIPFTIHEHKLQVFVSTPQVIRISNGNSERYVSLTLPDVAKVKWTPDQNVLTGIPPRSYIVPRAYGFWKLLAVLGGALWLIEWLLYSGRRPRKVLNRAQTAEFAAIRRDSRELVAK